MGLDGLPCFPRDPLSGSMSAWQRVATRLQRSSKGPLPVLILPQAHSHRHGFCALPVGFLDTPVTLFSGSLSVCGLVVTKKLNIFNKGYGMSLQVEQQLTDSCTSIASEIQPSLYSPRVQPVMMT